MNLGIVGSRSFRCNYDAEIRAKEIILSYIKSNNVNKLISGGADGPDKWAEDVAKENEVEIKVYLPNWDVYGKRAGFIRNKDIVEDTDLMLIFWDGKSKGTNHDICIAHRQNTPYVLFLWDKFKKEWRKSCTFNC
jgi:hypothetical protein